MALSSCCMWRHGVAQLQDGTLAPPARRASRKLAQSGILCNHPKPPVYRKLSPPNRARISSIVVCKAAKDPDARMPTVASFQAGALDTRLAALKQVCAVAKPPGSTAPMVVEMVLQCHQIGQDGMASAGLATLAGVLADSSISADLRAALLSVCYRLPQELLTTTDGGNQLLSQISSNSQQPAEVGVVVTKPADYAVTEVITQRQAGNSHDVLPARQSNTVSTPATSKPEDKHLVKASKPLKEQKEGSLKLVIDGHVPAALQGDEQGPRRGVRLLPAGGWQVRLKVDGKTRSFGTLDTPEAAARQRDMLALKFWGSTGKLPKGVHLNFAASSYTPEEIAKLPGLEAYRYLWSAGKMLKPVEQTLGKPRLRGVYQAKSKKYLATIELDGTPHTLGLYATLEEAGREADLALYRVKGEQADLNYPQYLEEYKAAAALKPTSSQYKGLTWSDQRQRWMARLQQSGKQLLQKWFAHEEDAARAYDQAVITHLPKEVWGDKLNFPEEHGVEVM